MRYLILKNTPVTNIRQQQQCIKHAEGFALPRL
jgi:hypothetical protein